MHLGSLESAIGKESEKLINKREDMQKRIVERTSYKENLQKKKEELEKLRKKKEAYERKNIGGYKQAFPSLNHEKQELYEEYLKAAVCTLPFPTSKMNTSLTNGAKGKNKSGLNDPKKSSTMPKLK